MSTKDTEEDPPKAGHNSPPDFHEEILWEEKMPQFQPGYKYGLMAVDPETNGRDTIEFYKVESGTYFGSGFPHNDIRNWDHVPDAKAPELIVKWRKGLAEAELERRAQKKTKTHKANGFQSKAPHRLRVSAAGVLLRMAHFLDYRVGV